MTLEAQRYQAFIDNSAEGIWRCEVGEPVLVSLSEDEQIAAFYRSGYLAEANDAFARMYGFARGEEMRGALLGDLLVRSDPANEAYLRAFIRSGYRLENARSVETDKEGRIRHFSNSLTGVVEDGRLVRAWGTQRDITAQYEAETRLRESEERFRALADNIAQLAWMADPSGAIFWYNRRWFDYTGATFSEMQGWGWQRVHHPDFVEAVADKFRAYVAAGRAWEDTFPLRSRDGEYRWFLSRAFPTRDAAGNVVLWCGTNTDVTRERDAENALKQGEERVKALYELTARTDLTFEEKVNRLLASGREWLGLDVGVLARMDCDKGVYEVVKIASESEAIPVGFTSSMTEAFCAEMKMGSDCVLPLAVANAGDDVAWRAHPTYLAFGGEAYVTAPVWTGDNNLWGLVSFVGATLRPIPFTDFDKDLVRLMVQWIGGEFAREEAQEALRAQAAQQRRFVREMLASVTEGKLRLCETAADLPLPLPLAGETIALTARTLRLLRQSVAEINASVDLPEERGLDLLTAVGEASMNAVRHAGGGEGYVRYDPQDAMVQVWITDQGTGIREEDLHRATLEKGWSGAGSLGHGFFLMLRTVDRTFLLTGADGTTVVLEQERTPSEPIWFANDRLRVE